MAKLRIFTFPDPVLAQKAKPIERPGREQFKTADDMLETMYYAPGIGLAANQVGLLERIIVVDTDYRAYEPEEVEEMKAKGQDISFIKSGEVINGEYVVGKNPLILMNPEIILAEGKNKIEEACLSVPDFFSEVDRAEKIKVKYQTVDGLEKVLSAEGLLAICLQHEIDHLEGRLFIDRLSMLKREFAKKKLLKARRGKSE